MPIGLRNWLALAAVVALVGGGWWLQATAKGTPRPSWRLKPPPPNYQTNTGRRKLLPNKPPRRTMRNTVAKCWQPKLMLPILMLLTGCASSSPVCNRQRRRASPNPRRT